MFTHPLALASLIVIPLAQVPLVAYLSRYVELDETAERQDPTEGYVTYGTADARPDRNGPGRERNAGDDGSGIEGRICPHCTHPVEGSYEFCGNCTGRVRRRGARR